MGASGAQATGYTIDQSIRFNDGDSPYMARTFGTPTNAKKWTLSSWAKLAGVTDEASGGVRFLDAGGSAGNDAILSIGSGYAGYEKIYFWDRTSSSYNWRLETTALFRDPSAWYHIVFVYDSDNSVSSERMKLYLNGERVTDFAQEVYPSSGEASRINTAVAHRIGATVYASSNYSNGYAAEMHFIDGQALTPASFGEFKEDTDIWIPKEYTGSYGNNGFKIDGRDSSDLGDDESGNGNDFTTSGLAAHDQVLDSPTNNFSTINSVYADNAAAGNAGTLSNGNLQYVGGGSTFSVKGLTFDLPKSGKWYFEYMIGGSLDGFGFVKQGEQGTMNASNGPGQLSVAQGGGIQYTGWRNGGSNTTTFADSNTGSPFTAGFIHQVAIDVDNGKFYYGVKNTYYAADGGDDGNPSGGTNHMSTFAFSTTDVVLLAGNYSGTQYWNFGQDGTFAGQQTAQGNSDANGIGNFFYAPPTGYLALCTSNLGS